MFKENNKFLFISDYLINKYPAIFSFLRKNIFLIILLLISLIVYHKWFFDFSILTYNDWNFKFDETLKELSFLPHPLVSNLNLGHINQSPFNYPINLLSGILARIGFSWNVIERLLFMWPIAIIGPIGSFLLIKKIIHSDIGAFVGAFLFSFNTYFLSAYQNGHLSLMIAYILSPIFIFLFLEAFEKRKIVYLIITGLVGFIISAYDFRIFYSVVWIAFFYFLFDLFIHHNYSYRKIIQNFFIFLIPILIVLLLNLYWLYPFFFHQSNYYIEAIERGVMKNNFTILNSLALNYPLRYLGMGNFDFRNVPVYFWAIPIFGFLGLFLNRKNKKILFFGFLTLLGVLLGKQIANPFPNFYYWLFDHVPGFNGFREASKHYFIIAIGYSVLIGSFIGWIWKEWNEKNKFKVYLKYFILFCIIFLSIWNTRLIINGKLGSIFVPKQIPEDYLILKNFILKQEEHFAILWIPSHSKWSIFANDHQLLGLNSLVMDWGWKDRISHNYWNNNNPIMDELTYVLNQEYSNQFIDITSIKYLVIVLDDNQKTEEYYNLFDLYGNREFFINDLNKLTYLQKINIDTEELLIYENKDFRPCIYITREKETIHQNIPYENADHQFKNPTEYKISLKNISQPVYLNFSESYHSEWKIRTGDFNWFKVLLDENYFLPNENHFKNDANLNSFYIDPEYIKQNLPPEYYKENPDGSIDIEMVLYFYPQSFFYLGLLISGITLSGCVGYLLYDFKKRRRKKIS